MNLSYIPQASIDKRHGGRHLQDTSDWDHLAKEEDEDEDEEAPSHKGKSGKGKDWKKK